MDGQKHPSQSAPNQNETFAHKALKKIKYQ